MKKKYITVDIGLIHLINESFNQDIAQTFFRTANNIRIF